MADSRPDLWAERVSLDDIDAGAGHTNGVVVSVERISSMVLERVADALDDARLDRIEVRTPVGREDLCAALVVMRECQSLDVELGIEFDDGLGEFESSWAHLLSRLPDGESSRELYRRHGPGFVQVVDDRPGHHVRIVFDDPGDVDLIARLERPAHIVDVDAARLQTLREFDLVAVVDDVAVLTVARIKRWPVPIDDLFDPPTA